MALLVGLRRRAARAPPPRRAARAAVATRSGGGWPICSSPSRDDLARAPAAGAGRDGAARRSRCAARRRRAAGARRRWRCTGRSSASSTAISRRAASQPPSTPRACSRCSAASWPPPRPTMRRPRSSRSRGPLCSRWCWSRSVAFALYIAGGVARLPSGGAARATASRPRSRRRQEGGADRAACASSSRTLDPHSRAGAAGLSPARQRGGQPRRNMPAAAEAWRTALGARFDPTLAARDGRGDHRERGPRHRRGRRPVPPRARRSRRPTRAWRPMAEKRLNEAERGG